MSVFSKIKRSREQAKEHTAKEAEKAKEGTVKVPYKHVPTHAAFDALSGAPSTWRHEDRPKIMEQNRRRSAMAASGLGLGMPRAGSSLYHVSYPAASATPVVPLPKNYSFSSMPASWKDKIAYPQGDYFGQPGSGKGKQQESAHPLPSGLATPMVVVGQSGRSIASSSKVTSRAGSSGTSSSSEDEIEIHPTRHNVMTYSIKTQSPEQRPIVSRQNSAGSEKLYRMYPAHRRKTSASQSISATDRQYPPAARSTHFTAPQPMNPETMNETSIPPVPALPALAFESNTISPSVSGPVSSASSIHSVVFSNSTAPSSVASTPVHPAVATFTSFSKKAVPVQSEYMSPADTFMSNPYENMTTASVQSQTKSRRRLSKTTRFNEMEAESISEEQMVNETSRPSAAATAATVRQLNQAMQQAGSEPVDAPTTKSPKRISKTPEAMLMKEAKKNRWSFRSSKPAAIAA